MHYKGLRIEAIISFADGVDVSQSELLAIAEQVERKIDALLRKHRCEATCCVTPRAEALLSEDGTLRVADSKQAPQQPEVKT